MCGELESCIRKLAIDSRIERSKRGSIILIVFCQRLSLSTFRKKHWSYIHEHCSRVASHDEANNYYVRLRCGFATLIFCLLFPKRLIEFDVLVKCILFDNFTFTCAFQMVLRKKGSDNKTPAFSNRGRPLKWKDLCFFGVRGEKHRGRGGFKSHHPH